MCLFVYLLFLLFIYLVIFNFSIRRFHRTQALCAFYTSNIETQISKLLVCPSNCLSVRPIACPNQTKSKYCMYSLLSCL